jgi:hypothetical protein
MLVGVDETEEGMHCPLAAPTHADAELPRLQVRATQREDLPEGNFGDEATEREPHGYRAEGGAGGGRLTRGDGLLQGRERGTGEEGADRGWDPPCEGSSDETSQGLQQLLA